MYLDYILFCFLLIYLVFDSLDKPYSDYLLHLLSSSVFSFNSWSLTCSLLFSFSSPFLSFISSPSFSSSSSSSSSFSSWTFSILRLPLTRENLHKITIISFVQFFFTVLWTKRSALIHLVRKSINYDKFFVSFHSLLMNPYSCLLYCPLVPCSPSPSVLFRNIMNNLICMCVTQCPDIN